MCKGKVQVKKWPDVALSRAASPVSLAGVGDELQQDGRPPSPGGNFRSLATEEQRPSTLHHHPPPLRAGKQASNCSGGLLFMIRVLNSKTMLTQNWITGTDRLKFAVIITLIPEALKEEVVGNTRS